MEVKEPIEGVCDNDNVLVLSPVFGKGQVEAVCTVSEDEMEVMLNEKVQFLKDNPDFEGKGMMQFVINCKGEVCRCQIDNESGSEELDSQIIAVFKTFKDWKAGTYNGKAVDSMVLISYTFKEGKIIFN